MSTISPLPRPSNRSILRPVTGILLCGLLAFAFQGCGKKGPPKPVTQQTQQADTNDQS